MDEFAGELKLIGVTTTAYTCRCLNYNNIKNIIINASKSQIKGNIARRFIAVPPDIYNSLNETYALSERQVKYKEDGMPANNAVEPTIVEGKITPYPQPMFDESGHRMEGYYYKCPCGRGKTTGKAQTQIQQQYFNQVSYVGNSDGESNDMVKKSGVSCYQCRMCYEPKSSISDKPIVVYVQVHSTEKDQFNYKQQNGAGFSQDYASNYSTVSDLMQQDLASEKEKSKKKKKINEVFETEDNNQELAIQQITNNAIQSVNEHLMGLTQQKLEEERIKKDFFDTLNKLM